MTQIATQDPVWLERYLHQAFAHRRVKGEWFRLTEEEVSVLLAIPACDDVHDLPVAVIAMWEINLSSKFSWGAKDESAEVPGRSNPLARRLPAPVKPAYIRCVVSVDEYRKIEQAAIQSRLSIVSWVRVAIIAAIQNPNPNEWLRQADKLMAVDTCKPKPGRPRKKK